jgi:hypothetical protein
MGSSVVKAAFRKKNVAKETDSRSDFRLNRSRHPSASGRRIGPPAGDGSAARRDPKPKTLGAGCFMRRGCTTVAEVGTSRWLSLALPAALMPCPSPMCTPSRHQFLPGPHWFLQFGRWKGTPSRVSTSDSQSTFSFVVFKLSRRGFL